MAEACWGGVRFCACCARLFDPDQDLRDGASRRVFQAFGLCQDCQDIVYGPEGSPVTKVSGRGQLTVLTKTLQ